MVERGVASSDAQRVGQEQARRERRERVLEGVHEEERRDERVEEAAHRAAGRQPQVELGERFRRRTTCGQFDVARQRHDEERGQVQHDQRDRVDGRCNHQRNDEDDGDREEVADQTRAR